MIPNIYDICDEIAKAVAIGDEFYNKDGKINVEFMRGVFNIPEEPDNPNGLHGDFHIFRSLYVDNDGNVYLDGDLLPNIHVYDGDTKVDSRKRVGRGQPGYITYSPQFTSSEKFSTNPFYVAIDSHDMAAGHRLEFFLTSSITTEHPDASHLRISREIQNSFKFIYTNNVAIAIRGDEICNAFLKGEKVRDDIKHIVPLSMHVFPPELVNPPGQYGFVVPISTEELLVRGCDRGTLGIAVIIRVQKINIADKARELLNYMDNLDPRSIQQRLKRNLNTEDSDLYIDYQVAQTTSGLDALDEGYVAGTVALTVQRAVDTVPANLRY